MTTLKKIIVGAISTIFLLAVVIGIVHNVIRSPKSDHHHIGSSEEKIDVAAVTKSIDSLCQLTDYKETCIQTLNSVSTDNKTTDPKLAVTASIKSTLAEYGQFIAKSKNIGNGTTVFYAFTCIHACMDWFGFTYLRTNVQDKLNKQALSDCQELLAFANSELQDALDSSEKGDAENIRRRSKDLNNWLSAVMAYQVTCIDGLTHPELKSEMTNGMNKATELTKNALAIITEITKFLDSMKGALNLKDNVFGAGGRKLLNSGSIGDRYPYWFGAAERKLLQAAQTKKVTPDAVVAKDGSGDCNTIQQCIDKIPAVREGRYIIHVKAGVYHENVIIGKKTKDVFMYGDGARRTTVTASLNNVDGVTTFNSATFGRYSSLSDSTLTILSNPQLSNRFECSCDGLRIHMQVDGIQ